MNKKQEQEFKEVWKSLPYYERLRIAWIIWTAKEIRVPLSISFEQWNSITLLGRWQIIWIVLTIKRGSK